MNSRAALRRLQARLYRGKMAVLNEGVSFRTAALRFHVPKSTLHDYVKGKTGNARMGRPPLLTEQEEKSVVEALLHFADCGVPLCKSDVQEAIAFMVSSFPEARRMSLSFKNGRPGRAFMRGFLKRHHAELRVCVPEHHEAKRYAAVNAETLTSHVAKVERLVQLHGIDAGRFWNLDETGTTPGRDVKGNGKQRRYMRRNGSREARVPEFVRANRVTTMPVISARGDTGPPLFVLQGKRLPYRRVVEGGVVRTQTYADLLPRTACIALREERGAVDSTNFVHWAHKFVESVSDLTANGRHVLLTYDAYNAHMSLTVLMLFRTKRIVVYALPAHTSGKTQPLDVVAFSIYKRELNTAISSTVRVGHPEELDMWQYCSILAHAYYKAFTRENIVSSFGRSGLWPLDVQRLLGTAKPRDTNALGEICTTATLINLLEQKRRQAREGILGAELSVLRTGFVDTSRGAVLTSPEALAIAKRKADSDEKKREAEHIALNRRAARQAAQDAQRKKQRAREFEFVCARRASLAHMSVGVFKAQLRSLKERRAVARVKATERGRQARIARIADARESGAPLRLLASVACDSVSSENV